MGDFLDAAMLGLSGLGLLHGIEERGEWRLVFKSYCTAKQDQSQHISKAAAEC